MLPFLTSIITGITSIFGIVFQTKAAKVEGIAMAVSKTIDLLKDVNATDAQIAQAISATIVAEAQSESWLTRMWRPMAMIVIAGMIGFWMFGHVPPNITGTMPPVLDRLFDILTYGICGYIPGRTLEKIAKVMMTPKLVNSIADQISKIK